MLGGSIFNDLNGSSRNVGVSIAGAYHLPLSKNALSFLSLGLAVKAVQNILDYPDPEDGSPSQPSKKTFFPNIDLGVYYYTSNLYAGVSATNLFGNPDVTDSTDFSEMPVSQEYFIRGGYKILIQRINSFVLEPSIIVSSGDSIFNDIGECIHPLLKIYLKDFCIGTYFNSNETYSFSSSTATLLYTWERIFRYRKIPPIILMNRSLK